MKLSGIANIVLALSIASSSSHLGNAMPVRSLWPEGRRLGKIERKAFLDKFKNSGDWPSLPVPTFFPKMKFEPVHLLPKK
jgi:hypothetical protein